MVSSPRNPNPAEYDGIHRKEEFVSVPQLILREAARRPDAVALFAECRKISFGELARAAELLAVSFQRNGAQAGGVIALLTDNTFEMIAGALAAWKTLCGYLPLDPAAPAARVLHMLTESKARLWPPLLARYRLYPPGRGSEIRLRPSSSELAIGRRIRPKAGQRRRMTLRT